MGTPFIQSCISELSPPALWCSIISSQLSSQNCHCPDCSPVVLLIAEPSLSRPWVLDRMVPSFITHVLELTSCPPLRCVNCCCISVTKTEGKGESFISTHGFQGSSPPCWGWLGRADGGRSVQLPHPSRPGTREQLEPDVDIAFKGLFSVICFSQLAPTPPQGSVAS